MTTIGVNGLTNIHIGPQIDIEVVETIYTKNQIICCKNHEKVIIQLKIGGYLDHSPRGTGSTPSNGILGLWEYSQYCYTTVVGVMSQFQFLTENDRPRQSPQKARGRRRNHKV